MEAMTMDEHQVRDGEQMITFSGSLLGSSSSWEPGKLRWVEIKIFKTAGGSFVASRVGRSVVYHRLGCPTITSYDGSARGDVVTDFDAIPDFMIGCPKCKPTFDTATFVLERDREWAQVSDTAGGMIEGLRQRDPDGVWFMPRVVQDAVRQAGRNDTAVHAAFTNRRID